MDSFRFFDCEFLLGFCSLESRNMQIDLKINVSKICNHVDFKLATPGCSYLPVGVTCIKCQYRDPDFRSID
jgi:hypothetical protein